MRVLLIAVVTLTSAAAVWLGVRRLGLPAAGLPGALGRVLEVVGLAAVCLVVNAALAAAAVLVLRALGPVVFSLYVVGPTLGGLSLLQALVFRAWAAIKWPAERPSWYDGPDKGPS
jgi:hypothetical protein